MIFLGIDGDIYIADPSVEVEALPDTRTYVEEGPIVFLLGGQYGRKYSIKLDWSEGASDFTETVTRTTPNGSSASHINDVATDDIAAELEILLDANVNIAAKFDITRESDVIYISAKAASGVTFSKVTASDGDGGTNMFGVNNAVLDAGRVPRYAPQGYVIHITEGGQSNLDDWYLEFVVTSDEVVAVGDGFGQEGVWVETVAPGLVYKLAPDTLPHVLSKTGPTAFEFNVATWDDRSAGDDDTVKMPSFVGHTINDMNSFQGRLSLTADVNLVMSRTNKHTNFFQQSATILVDDDPIDISSAVGTYVLKTLTAHNRDLIVSSDKAQFIVFGRTALTPKNSSLVLTTQFEVDLRARPVSAGKNIILAFTYGTFTGLQEFFTEGSEDVNDARPITQHVLKYVAGSPLQLINTTNFKKILCRTDNDLKDVYLYEYIWQDRKKVQASWSTLKFSKDVQHMFFVDNLLYVVTDTGTEFELFTLDLDDVEDTGVGYRVALDEKTVVTGAGTTFDAPYPISDINDYVVVQGTGCPNPGMSIPIVSYSDPTLTLAQDMLGGDVILGRRYMSRYIPTQPFVRDRDGVKIDAGTLTIKNFLVNFTQTGYFKAIITDLYGYLAEVIYNGRVLGAPSNTVGNAAITEGNYRVPFKKNPDTSSLEIQSDSHEPMSLLELAWNGQYKKKGKRIIGG